MYMCIYIGIWCTHTLQQVGIDNLSNVLRSIFLNKTTLVFWVFGKQILAGFGFNTTRFLSAVVLGDSTWTSRA